MGEILFLAHRIPFPPDRGDKIRSHHVLRRLAELAPVHVATFADDEGDLAQEAELAAVARSYRLVRRPRNLVAAGLRALRGGRPVSLDAFRHRSLQHYVSRVLENRPVETIYMFSGQMGQYVPSAFAGRFIADFVDVDSAKFDAYAAKRRGPASMIHAREGRLLRAEEARITARASASVLISDNEAALFRERLPDDLRGAARIEVIGNGLDSTYFDPARVTPERRMLECSGPRLVFTGQMDYAPNEEAALRVIDRILPDIRRQLPEATFHVVGRNPSARLTRRSGEGGVHVWGRVEDIRPWLKAADLAIVPLEIARGVQNKVLEAMAMGLPTVLTSGAANGIAARDGVHFRVADADEALVRESVALAFDPAASRDMQDAARRWVVENASWKAALAGLAPLAGFGEARDAS
jgi:sugar transferase (PEP-CTERM/EpsH1 system associated)